MHVEQSHTRKTTLHTRDTAKILKVLVSPPTRVYRLTCMYHMICTHSMYLQQYVHRSFSSRRQFFSNGILGIAPWALHGVLFFSNKPPERRCLTVVDERCSYERSLGGVRPVPGWDRCAKKKRISTACYIHTCTRYDIISYDTMQRCRC